MIIFWELRDSQKPYTRMKKVFLRNSEANFAVTLLFAIYCIFAQKSCFSKNRVFAMSSIIETRIRFQHDAPKASKGIREHGILFGLIKMNSDANFALPYYTLFIIYAIFEQKMAFSQKSSFCHEFTNPDLNMVLAFVGYVVKTFK